MEHKIKKWKLLESEYLYRRPWLTARRDKVELPDGRIHPEYYVLEYPSWVNIIAITEDGEFVLVEQYRHGLGEVGFELCAGVVEDGEAPVDGAKRELMEETGFGGGEWELFATLSPNASATNNLSYTYLARGVRRVTDKQHLDATEDVAVHVVSREEVYKLLSTGEIKQATMAAPLWKFFALER
ncbi:MAG: NUDIX hydrolase [Muribaculaceae bacterium]|nr:NUDIX hydrolase [Muribaculaceae bacterium]